MHGKSPLNQQSRAHFHPFLAGVSWMSVMSCSHGCLAVCSCICRETLLSAAVGL